MRTLAATAAKIAERLDAELSSSVNTNDRGVSDGGGGGGGDATVLLEGGDVADVPFEDGGGITSVVLDDEDVAFVSFEAVSSSHVASDTLPVVEHVVIPETVYPSSQS